jgi:hypothetical protein
MTSPVIQYHQALDLLERLDREIDRVQAQIDSAVQAGLRKLEELREHLGDWVDKAETALVALGRRVKELAAEVQAEIAKVRIGADAPDQALRFAVRWQELRKLATQVSADVRNPKLRFTADDWHGKAADRYFDVVAPQVSATDRIAASAERMTNSLNEAAKETTSFVLVMATTVSALLFATVTATVAMASGVAAIPATVTFAATSVGLTFTMRKAANDYAAAQLRLSLALEGDASNSTEFPGGKWPKAASVMIDDPTP